MLTADSDEVTADSVDYTADGGLITYLTSNIMAKQNLGKSSQFAMPKYIKRIFVTTDAFRLEVADMATPAAFKIAMQAAIKAAINNRSYLFPKFFRTEKMSTETVYEETPIAMVDVNDGQYRWKHHIAKDLFTHKALQSHKRVNEGRVFIQDLDNQIIMMKDTDGKGAGFSIGILKPEKMNDSDGANVATSPILLVLDDNEEFDVSGHILDKTFGAVFNTLDPLTDVTITLASAALAASLQFEVKQSSDNVPVSGLLVADILVYNAAGTAEQAKGVLTPDANIPGRYTLAQAGGDPFESGSITLRAASALTAAVGAYECPAPLAFVI